MQKSQIKPGAEYAFRQNTCAFGSSAEHVRILEQAAAISGRRSGWSRIPALWITSNRASPLLVETTPCLLEGRREPRAPGEVQRGARISRGVDCLLGYR